MQFSVTLMKIFLYLLSKPRTLVSSAVSFPLFLSSLYQNFSLAIQVPKIYYVDDSPLFYCLHKI